MSAAAERKAGPPTPEPDRAEAAIQAAAPAQAAPQPAPQQEPKMRPVGAGQFRPVNSSETAYGSKHGCMTPAGTPFRNVLRPDYWTIVAHALREHDLIEVRTEDKAYFALLYVQGVDGPENKPATSANVSVILYARMSEHDESPVIAGHTVKWLSSRKWCVVEIETGAVLKDKKNTRAEAEAEMERIFAHVPRRPSA